MLYGKGEAPAQFTPRGLYCIIYYIDPSEGAGQVAFYLLLAVMLVWIEVMAIYLRPIAAGGSAGRVMSTG